MTLGDNEFLLKRVLEQCVHGYAPLAKVMGVELHVVSSQNLPAVCRGNASLVRKLLTGLLAQATFIRGGKVRLDACVVDGGAKNSCEDDQRLHLRFAVTSFPSVNSEKSPASLLLDQNTLLSDEFEKSRDGCRELARALGGGVHIFNEPGAGERISADIVLGVVPGPSAMPVSPPLFESSQKASIFDDKASAQTIIADQLCALGLATLDPDILVGLRTLVVDDNSFNLEVVEPVLAMIGIEVATARSGPEALAFLESDHEVDVVLMDMQMPEMDGCETTRRIRAIPRLRSLPVLALTANEDPTAREQCLACGMNDFLSKPLDTPALIKALARWSPRCS